MRRSHTRRAEAVIVLAAIIVALTGNLSGTGGIVAAPARPPSAVPLGTAGAPAAQQANLAADLAARLTGAASLEEALAATQEALARGGIATADLDTTRAAAAPPAASLRVSTAETVRLALEARGRATALRLTGAELGRMLADAGWPVPAGSTPGGQTLGFLRAWVTEAQQRPTDPQAFAPLFLAELARRQSPPVDLTDATTGPEDLRLTLLELLLLGAAFDRPAAPPASALAVLAGTPTLQDAVQYRITSQVDPCLDLRQWYGGQLGDGGTVLGEGANIGRSELAGAALERIVGEGFGNAMAAVGIAARVWKLVSFYSNSQVAVLVDPTEPNPLHKKLTPYLVAFIARAGVSEEDYAAYQRALGDAQAAAHTQQVKACLSAAGLPSASDLADLAAEAESWRVEWRMVQGGDHAYIEAVDSGLSGTLRQHLARTSATTAEALVGVTVKPERAQDHPGSERRAPVTMCADVIASQPPSAGTFLNAAKGLLGLADALVELGIGWFEELVTPRSCATLTVTYHEARRARLALEIQGEASLNDNPTHYAYAGTADLSLDGAGTFMVEAPLAATITMDSVGSCTRAFTVRNPRLRARGSYRDTDGMLVVEELEVLQDAIVAREDCSFREGACVWEQLEGLINVSGPCGTVGTTSFSLFGGLRGQLRGNGVIAAPLGTVATFTLPQPQVVHPNLTRWSASLRLEPAAAPGGGSVARRTGR